MQLTEKDECAKRSECLCHAWNGVQAEAEGIGFETDVCDPSSKKLGRS